MGVRAGVLSDTHGAWEWAEKAVREMGEIDLLIHAGDYYGDALHLAESFQLPLRAVAGNCDRSLKGPGEELFLVEGVRVLLTHGHRYSVKRGMISLYARAREAGAQLVIFGHTHIPLNEEVRGIHFLNPGCRGAYAVVNFGQGTFRIETRPF